MKKLVLFSVFTFAIVCLFAQSNAPWKVNFNVGTRLIPMKTADAIYDCSAVDLGANVGIMYMFYNITDEDFLSSVGLKLDLGYDNVTSSIEGSDAVLVSNLKRASGQFVIDIDHLCGYEMYPFGLFGHIGGGLTLLQRANPKPDRLINGIVGLTPTFWITENMGVNIDLSFIVLDKQSFGVEMIDRFDVTKVGHYSNVSLGFVWGIPDYRSKNASF